MPKENSAGAGLPLGEPSKHLALALHECQVALGGARGRLRKHLGGGRASGDEDPPAVEGITAIGGDGHDPIERVTREDAKQTIADTGSVEVGDLPPRKRRRDACPCVITPARILRTASHAGPRSRFHAVDHE